MDEDTCERILASAVRYLIDCGENEAALLLLPCSLDTGSSQYSGDKTYFELILSSPPSSYRVLRARGEAAALPANPLRKKVRDAVIEHLPYGCESDDLIVRPEIIKPDPDWRIEAARAAGGKWIRNQAPDIQGGKIITWNYLRFRSETERRIAVALDTTHVLFFPNCVGRLNVDEKRGNREPDFLVCDHGRWGILEIDGGEFHGSAAKDHDRDRLFEAYSIKVIERYEASRCYHDAPSVVRDFLQLLAING